MKGFLSAVVMAIAGAVLTIPAYAQEINPCTKDFEQYCKHVTPGGGRMVQCYEENKDKMSTDCRGWAEAAKNYGATLKEVCSKELESGCSAEKGDPFATLDCLQGKYLNLSMDCRVRLNEFRSRYPKPVQ